MSDLSACSDLVEHVSLLNEAQIIERIFNHIDNGTTDLGDTVWRELTPDSIPEIRGAIINMVKYSLDNLRFI